MRPPNDVVAAWTRAYGRDWQQLTTTDRAEVLLRVRGLVLGQRAPLIEADRAALATCPARAPVANTGAAGA